MAENFAAFDYKTQEEVFTVIKYLTTVLSTTGMELLEMISPSHLLAQLRAPSGALQPPNVGQFLCSSALWTDPVYSGRHGRRTTTQRRG